MDTRYLDYAKKGEVDGQEFFYTLAHKDFQYDGPFITHTVEVDQDFYLISYMYYNIPEYWWIIAWHNDFFDPFVPPVGTILQIPQDMDLIRSVLGGVT